ncbi:EVE domain-containing protein [Methanoculleus sp.]|uniref:EVE domain-containing protein n=1 Tax=Methanoculleus sp. TaxID=90427 RepID=UPI0025DDCC2F|nr:MULTISPECIES: EVE domain-containing protein [unclassified Methanoculleus]MDD2253751.1 EVE domain-containing protein [Methanoculleus sp.]MDD2787640.1 EVE domain-containing protein [Methanoculleus sp.]MDD3216603.1 EVE domain-containing protein [Methanoculleus sp.]MDD4314626.1 EVE domain-containing protein [Methanoculleus sp.]MDD4471004.1 EVE domain-containing protein [Methanoculleus sp.]
MTGAFEVTSTMYEDASRIFTSPANLGDEVFPLRINLKPIRVFEPPVAFKPLIPELKFITNKKM